MTTYRLFPSTSGPSSPVSYSGNILVGVIFKVTASGMWFSGYWKWVATGEDTTARKFALWQITGASTGTLIPAATVTSGTLTANAWNFVSLATPIPLAIGTAYNACTGWSAVSGHGFSDSDTSGAGTGATDSFGSGGHSTGITNGPLFAYSDQPGNGTKPEPYGTPQGVFSVAGTDATVNMPGTGSNSGNFWMDVQVSDTGPANYSGSYRLWPAKVDANSATVADASVNYDVGTEFALSQACTLNKIWYYSPSTATQLATVATVWNITGGGLTGTVAAQNASPSWSGAAASGWLSCSFTGVTLPAGKYKVSVYNGAGSPAACFAKDANTDYWRNGDGANGITWGPVSAPNLSSSSLAWNYNGNAGGTPPFSDGTTLAGQSTFTQGPPDQYPYLVALVATPTAGSTQNYWVDAEVTPVPPVPQPPMPAQPGRTWLRRFHHRQVPPVTTFTPVTVPGAATLTAAASLAAPVVQRAAATLAGSASLAAPDATQQAGAVLGGAGSVAAPAVQGAAATLTGSASLATPSALQGSPASLAGTASVAAPDATQSAGAALTGTASLGTSSTQDAGATLTAAGSIAAPASQGSSASLSAAGSLAAAPTQDASTSLQGAASLASPSQQGAPASLAATGSLAATAVQQPGATLAAAGSLATVAAQQASALLAGAGSFAGSPTGTGSGSAVLTGTALLAQPGTIQATGASLAAAAALTAPSGQDTATVLAAAAVLAGSTGQEAAATLLAVAALTAIGGTRGTVTSGTIVAAVMALARVQQGQAATAHTSQGQMALAHAQGGQWP